MGDKPQDDSSRLRLFLGLLRKYVETSRPRLSKNSEADQASYRFIGVPDMAAVRFSLPAQLIEPIPNLGGATSEAAVVDVTDGGNRILALPG